MGPSREELLAVVEPAVNAAGYDLVELEFRREGRGFVLRVYIDLLDGEEPCRITVDDCERASRTISAALDVADPIPVQYDLEVSSPGLDRPLRRERDFAKYAGESATIRLREPLMGRRNFSGRLLGAAEGIVRIECDGKPVELPIDAIMKAHLVFGRNL